MGSLRFLLACLAGISFVSAIIAGIFASRLEIPITHFWMGLFNKKLPGPKPAAGHYIVWLGLLIFVCISFISTMFGVLLDSGPTSIPPITVVVPTGVASSYSPLATGAASFSPFVEEFTNSAEFTQTVDAIYLDDAQAVCNVSRSGGDQFLYRDIPNINGDLQFTVVGQVNDWTNNCQCQIGIGNKVGEGIGIGFGYFGGGCSSQGALVIPVGEVSQPWFADSCEDMEKWSWITPQRPYRVSLTVKGADVTFNVEGNEVEKHFTTTTYNQNYNILWVGLRGDGDWPQCSATFNSVTIEPVR